VCSPSERTSGERSAARRDATGSVGGQELRDERAEVVGGDEQPEVAVVEDVQRGCTGVRWYLVAPAAWQK
jgi:hypothetical protein